MCVCNMHTRMYRCKGQKPQVKGWSCCILLHLLHLRQGLVLNLQLLSPFPQALELQACGQPTLAFYMDAGDSNSGPHTCSASTLNPLSHLSISALKVLIIGKPSLSLFKKKSFSLENQITAVPWFMMGYLSQHVNFFSCCCDRILWNFS